MAHKMVHKLTERKIRYFIADERKATREYRKYGLTNLAGDEAGHHAYLKGILKLSKEWRRKFKRK